MTGEKVMQFTEITAKDNPRIKHAIKLQKSAHFRYDEGLFVLEGLRTVDDASENSVQLKELYVTKEAYDKHPSDIKKFAHSSDFTAIISNSVAKSISDTVSTQGIFAVAKIPEVQKELCKNKKYIALENLQDPSNLGAVARTAEALGIDGIILSLDSCDPFSPKALRASMGTLLRLPLVFTSDMTEFLGGCGMKTYACVAHGNARKLNEISFNDGCICVIGNEANGIKADTIAVCSDSITIPMKGRAESLNAAAAASIVMWEMVK
jgi:TrmH family RNA methyltransferase